MLRSKIHNATVTQANLHYVGSITIDHDLIDRVGLLAGEKVLIVDNSNGNRLETYVIGGPRGEGQICMNGAAAHLINPGDEIIIMGFELADGPVEAQVILVDKQNNFTADLTEVANMEVPPQLYTKD